MYFPLLYEVAAASLTLAVQIIILLCLLIASSPCTSLYIPFKGSFKYALLQRNVFLLQMIMIVWSIVLTSLLLLQSLIQPGFPVSCNILFKLNTALYIMVSFWIYNFLNTKAEISNVSANSKALQLTGKLLKLATNVTPAMAVIAAVFNSGEYIQTSDPHTFACTSNAPLGVILMFAILDTGLNIGYFFYFVFPLRELTIKNTGSVEDFARTNILVEVAKSNFKTCCLAVFSTVFSMFCIALANSEIVSTSVKIVLHSPVLLNILINNIAILYSTKNAWKHTSHLNQRSTQLDVLATV